MSRDRELLTKWANTQKPFDRIVWVDDGISIADVKRAAREALADLEHAEASKENEFRLPRQNLTEEQRAAWLAFLTAPEDPG